MAASTISDSRNPRAQQCSTSTSFLPARILDNASGYQTYSLQQFFEQFIPTLPHLVLTDELLDRWSNLLLMVRCSATEDAALPPLTKFSGRTHQSHADLLHDCIECLVKRQQLSQSHRSRRNSSRNVLAAGFAIQESQSTRVHQGQLNAAVDFLRTSPSLIQLHQRAGDDVMRYILLHTSLFLKIPVQPHEDQQQQYQQDAKNGNSNNRHNFWQLTGPPLAAVSLKPNEPHEASFRRKKKRQRQRPPLRHSTNLQHLAPDQCVSRVSLFYSAQFNAQVCDKLLIEYNVAVDPSNKNLWQTMIQEYLAVISVDNPRGTTMSRIEEPLWCQEFWKCHQRIDYARLLEHYCPIPTNYHELSLAELTKQYSTGVVSFARACLSRLLPRTLAFWGYEHNETVFLQDTLAMFVQLRRRERFPNKLLLANLRTTQIPWLLTKEGKQGGKVSRMDHEHSKLLLLSVLRWILRDYLIPLLAQCFYVTETEFGGQQIFYYRKPVWTRYRTLAMQKLLTKQYTELSERQAATRLAQQQMGLSALRLLPKATGVRPIATLNQRVALMLPIGSAVAQMQTAAQHPNDDDESVEMVLGPARKKTKTGLSSTSTTTTTKSSLHRPPRIPAPNQSMFSTNVMLAECFEVLSFEYNRHKHTFGAGLMGLHRFHWRYRQFIVQWKNGNETRKPLHFGSVDIRHCYDNIQQDHLLSVVADILQEDEYIVRKYGIWHPTGGGVRHRRCREVCLPEMMEPFGETVQVRAANHKGCVFVDGVHSVSVSKQQVVEQLREHLTSHTVVTKDRFGNRYLLQAQGIPQGSILSTLLCNFYYGNVEQRLRLPKSCDSLLTRMVDDFLMVTTDASQLQCFFAVMHRGDPGLGVTINHEKTCSSVTLEIPSEGDVPQTNTIPCTPGRFFPWCGMLLDSSTGEVRNDYTRFEKIKGKDGLTVQRVKQEGIHLLQQLKLFVKPRCLPVLFDPSINALSTQIVNFYQLFIFAAVKTAEYLRSLSCAPRVRLRHGQKMCASCPNAPFILRGIEATISYAHAMVQVQLRKVYEEMDESMVPLHNLLTRHQALWLGWQAFNDVFVKLSQSDLYELAVRHFQHLASSSFENCMTGESSRRRFWTSIVASALEDMKLTSLIESINTS